MRLVLRVDKAYPAANLHLAVRRRGRYHLGALHPRAEVPQVALGIGQPLLVHTLALRLQVAAQGIQLGHTFLQLAQAAGGHIVGLLTDAPLYRLIGLGGGLVLIDECSAHARPPCAEDHHGRPRV